MVGAVRALNFDAGGNWLSSPGVVDGQPQCAEGLLGEERIGT